MNTIPSTSGTGDTALQTGEFGRLVLALVLSSGLHLLVAESLPQAVRPYGGATPAAPFTLTVSLQPVPLDPPKAAAPVSVPVPIPVSETLKSLSTGTAQSDQPALSALPPDAPREALPESPAPELLPALPLLDFYYTSREVDEPAKAMGDALLVYPPEALKLRVSGEVKIRLFIDEFGALVRSEVIEAAPPGIFEEAALQALGGMKFSPARKDDQPVRSQRTVQITFDPTPAALRDTRSLPTR